MKSKELSEINLHPECSHQLKGKDAISAYVRGGHGAVTLKSPTGVEYTYRFITPKNTRQFEAGTVFVYVAQRHKSWAYVGMITPTNSIIKTRASEFYAQHPIFKGARYIARMMKYDFDTPMMLYHEGVCGACGRVLTDTRSIERGFGYKCYKAVTGHTS